MASFAVRHFMQSMASGALFFIHQALFDKPQGVTIRLIEEKEN
jgi:hypothetical protein